MCALEAKPQTLPQTLNGNLKPNPKPLTPDNQLHKKNASNPRAEKHIGKNGGLKLLQALPCRPEGQTVGRKLLDLGLGGGTSVWHFAYM